MTSHTIRIATAEDADAISTLLCRTWTETEAWASPPEDVQIFLETRLSPQKIASDLANDGHRLWVACDDRRSDSDIIAVVQLNTVERDDTITSPKPVHLQRLYVDSTYHGSGLAAELARIAEVEARRRGFESLWLCTWQGAGRAIRFYEKVGFKRCGEKGFAIGTTVHTDWVMQKML